MESVSLGLKIAARKRGLNHFFSLSLDSHISFSSQVLHVFSRTELRVGPLVSLKWRLLMWVPGSTVSEGIETVDEDVF